MSATAVAKGVFAPEEFIDRSAEQELFRELLACRDEARLLTIRDESGRGKSHLLKLLRYQCQYGQPRTPVSLVALDELEEKSAYAVVRSMERALRRFEIEFPTFREVEDRRIQRGLNIDASVNAGTATAGEGGRIAGLIVEGDFHVGDFDPDVQERLREQAVDAFLQDLRAASADRPLVVMLDTYESCGQDLEQWLADFLRDHVLDVERRPDKLIVVLAGRKVPTAGFKLMLGPRFESLVRSVEGLSVWGPEHVRAFLDASGVKGYGEEEVGYLCAVLQRGDSIGRAVSMIRQYLREEGD